MTRELTAREEIAIAITAAMRDNIKPLIKVLNKLRTEHKLDDYQIGLLFMEVGIIVFNEGDTDD